MQLFKLTAVILFFAMPLASAETLEEQCARIAPQQSNQVDVSIAELTVDESKSTTEDLAVMAGLYNGIDRQLGGLTSADPLVAHEIEPNLALLPDNKGVCARPSIKLTIGYASMSVYMDREIPRNSCIYNAIFAHEMHHVAIYKDYIARNIEQVKQNVEAKFNGTVYYFPSIFAAKQYTEILGQVFTQHVSDRFLGEVYAEQRALDTQSEYTRMQNECFH
jgi:hypothetical protein